MPNDKQTHLNDSLPRLIPREEISFHPHSFADPSGRVFQWGDQLYRGIRPEWEPFLVELFHSGIFADLEEKGLLIETNLTDYSLDEFPMVLQHRSVPFVSYPPEWCPAMLKAAALTIVDLAIELAHYGLTLKDAHPWNTLFDSCNPVYVDLGSIVPAGNVQAWPAYAEFSHYCLNPLILMAHGHDRISRLLISETGGVQENELFKLAPRYAIPAQIRRSTKRLISSMNNRISSSIRQSILGETVWQRTNHPKHLVGFLEQVRGEVEAIPVSPLVVRGEHRSDRPVPSEIQDERMSQILAQLRPGSVLDIYGGGRYAKQASLQGGRVVVFDTNLEVVTRIYQESCTGNYTILPLLMDFATPTPSRGLGSFWSISAMDRLPCDLVIALDLVNHPDFDRRLGIEQIVQGLDSFTRRWLVIQLKIQFVATNDQERDGSSPAHSLNEYLDELEKRFSRITTLSTPSEEYVLLLCEK